MLVRDLIKLLNHFDMGQEVTVASDEELNTIYKNVEVANLQGKDGRCKEIVIYGLSGSERADEYEGMTDEEALLILKEEEEKHGPTHRNKESKSE